MTKFILAILVALSLAASPSQAFSAPSAECSMPGADSGMAMDHEEMGCCTIDCAMGAPSAVLPGADAEAADIDPVSSPLAGPGSGVHPSASPAAIDPPPRA